MNKRIKRIIIEKGITEVRVNGKLTKIPYEITEDVEEVNDDE